MKILFLNDDYPPYSYGGAAMVAERLAKKFVEKGHEVFVVTTTQEKSHCHPEFISGSQDSIEKYEIPGQTRNDMVIYRIYTKYNLRWRAWKSIYNRKVVRELKKIIQEIQPDITHVHNIHTHLSYASLKLVRKYSKAVFMTAHDSMLFFYNKVGLEATENDSNETLRVKVGFWQRLKFAKKRFNPFREICIKHYMKNVDMIFTVSDVIKKALLANGFKKVSTIYNGIDMDNFTVGLCGINDFKKKFNLENKKIIFYGGRLSGAKGADLAVKYLAKAQEKIPNVILLVAGKEEAYNRSIKKLVEELNIEKKVVVAGWLDNKEMKQAFAAADVCITPSRYIDPCPLFNIEAMAVKKPVVGTCFGGTIEIIADGKTGYVVNPLRIQEYSDKIIQLLKDEVLAKQMGERGFERAKKMFNIEKQYKETLEWYNRFT